MAAAWSPSEDEEVNIAFYAAVHDGFVRVIDAAHDEYELTPIGHVRGRVMAMAAGFDPDQLSQHQLAAFVTGLISTR